MTLPIRVRFKALDIWDTPDDGKRYEVVDGDLVVSPPPDEIHQRVSMVLSVLLGAYIRDHGLGHLYAAPFGVILDEENAVQPDLVYISGEREQILTQRGAEGTPNLVIEILSPSTRNRDLGTKLRIFARAGIPHYWTIDPRARTLDARVLVGDDYQLTGTYGPGAHLRPALFPELEIALDDLWE